MKDVEKFKDFAKQSLKPKISVSGNVVIYTRVSTKEQAENNGSLELQLNACTDYAHKNNLSVVEYFGGTNESAKSDERKEFNRMLEFVRRKKNISCIIVYSFDRFSRTGASAMQISEELKLKFGTVVLSVTQPIDLHSSSGDLHKHMLYAFSQFDNAQRKEKSVSGMQQKLQKGYWIGTMPFGYTNLNPGKGKVQNIVVNEEGKILKYAFIWKSRENITNTEIALRLQKKGLKVNPKRLGEYFRNPFYCGKITSAHLANQVFEGQHEKLISTEVFFKIQDNLKKHGYGEKQNKEAEELPLKQFVKSSICNTPLSGYIVRKKKLWYYKTNRVGAKENISAKYMHKSFSEVLTKFQINNDKYKEPTKDMLLYAFKIAHKESIQENEAQIKNLNVLESKLDNLEERFVFNEISKEQYEKFKDKLTVEINQISAILEVNDFKLSNLEKALDSAIKYSSELSKLWEKGNLKTKKSIQYMLFPEGILFDFKNKVYRTTRVNLIFDAIGSLSSVLELKKSGKNSEFSDFSRFVPRAGIEPALS